MEIKANHVLIGAFTLLTVVATLVFLIWLGQFTFDRKFDEYRVQFDGGVSGLSVGSEVRYSGIKVGEVTGVGLDSADPRKVNVEFRVNADTPIKEDTVATIDVGILTGVGVLQLSGGTPESPELVAGPGQDRPAVRAGLTDIQQLAVTAPGLLAGASNFLARANALVSDTNRRAVAGILQDVKAVTGAVAARTADIEAMIGDLRTASASLARASADFEVLAADARKGAGPAFSQVTAAAENVSALAQSLDATLGDLRPSLRDFARGGLPQFVLFIQEARQLSQSLDRLVSRLESNPGGFLLGTDAPTYEPGRSGGRR